MVPKIVLTFNYFGVIALMGVGTMNGNWWVAVVSFCVSLVPMLVLASDPDPLQDFCVADNSTSVLINGFPCKNATSVSAADFMFAGLMNAGNTSNRNMALVTPATAAQFGGLNTLGISAARVDIAVGGLNPPHTHPRASEILLLVEGQLYVGFVSTSNVLFSTTLMPNQLFVFPKGLVHFELNTGNVSALGFGFLSSQNPGVQQVAPALFTPAIEDGVLEIGFRIDQQTVDTIRAQFRS